jgi:hypothetical protein
VVKDTSWPLYPLERDTVRTAQKAGRVPQPVWMRAENLAVIGTRSTDRPARYINRDVPSQTHVVESNNNQIHQIYILVFIVQ